MIEWGQKPRPSKNPWGFQQNPKKSLDQKLTPNWNPMPILWPLKVPDRGDATNTKKNISNPQVTNERNQKFTKAKQNSCNGKANWLNWSGWSLVHGRARKNWPIFPSFNPFPSMPSAATGDRKQFQYHQIVSNYKTRSLVSDAEPPSSFLYSAK